jgi:hypothetical protein
MRLIVLLLALLACSPIEAQTVILYSHADRAAAARVRSLAAVYGPVWLDADIQAGAVWRAEVAQRIRSARVVLVLWSASAAGSVEVGAEWRQALASRAMVVPVLLDGAEMPAELASRQGLDWR